MKYSLLVILLLLTFNFCFAQKSNKKGFLFRFNKLMDRTYFGNLNDMMMYRYETINYVLSDKNEKSLLSGFIRTRIEINSLTYLIIQNEYMYVSGKMNMNLNTPQIGLRKYF